MIKKLTKHGNSWALVLDKTVLALLEIDETAPLKLCIEGKKLIICQAEDEVTISDEETDKLYKEVVGEHSEDFARLAKD